MTDINFKQVTGFMVGDMFFESRVKANAKYAELRLIELLEKEWYMDFSPQECSEFIIDNIDLISELLQEIKSGITTS